MKICSIEGCGKRLEARGLCGTHYQRLKKGIPLDATPEEVEQARRQKISEKNKQVKHTPEWHAKISETRKRKFASGELKSAVYERTPEMNDKTRQGVLKAYEEGRLSREHLSELAKQQWANGHFIDFEKAWTPERRARQAATTLRAYVEGRMQAYGRHRGRWVTYEGPHGLEFMRSESEAIFAHKLDFYGIDWQYEPKRFDLGWTTYSPDFYIPAQDLWVEVKGHLTEQASRKMAGFREQGYQLIMTTYSEVRTEELPPEIIPLPKAIITPILEEVI